MGRFSSRARVGPGQSHCELECGVAVVKLNAVSKKQGGSAAQQYRCNGCQGHGLSGTAGRQAQFEQAGGSAANTAASAQLTQMRRVLRQAWRGAAYRAQPGAPKGQAQQA